MSENPAEENRIEEKTEAAEPAGGGEPETVQESGATAPVQESGQPAPEKQREHKHEIKKHKKKNYVLRFVVVLVILAAAVACAHLNYFDVKGIAVVGNEEITDEEIIKLAGVEPGGSIFDVHPVLVQHKIKKNLYIDKVNVNRKLPNEIEIVITERKTLIQFKKGDKFVVTDGEGMVLDISKEEHKATLVEGLTVTEAEKKDDIVIKESEGLEKVLELVNTTEENDLYFKRLVFNARKVDAYVYDGLKCSGKYDNLMSAITSGTLKKVIYDLYQKGVEKGTVNVYNNDYCFFTPN